jgi:hypothetical protein
MYKKVHRVMHILIFFDRPFKSYLFCFPMAPDHSVEYNAQRGAQLFNSYPVCLCKYVVCPYGRLFLSPQPAPHRNKNVRVNSHFLLRTANI